MIGRSAQANSLDAVEVSGFPTVRVPAGQESNWTFIHAITRQESQFDRQAISHAGARGMMQLMPGTAREVANKLGLGYDASSLTSDTNYNMTLGSTYFQQMLSYFGGSYPLAVAAYNAGPGNVNKWLRANGDPQSGDDQTPGAHGLCRTSGRESLALVAGGRMRQGETSVSCPCILIIFGDL